MSSALPLDFSGSANEPFRKGLSVRFPLAVCSELLLNSHQHATLVH